MLVMALDWPVRFDWFYGHRHSWQKTDASDGVCVCESAMKLSLQIYMQLTNGAIDSSSSFLYKPHQHLRFHSMVVAAEVQMEHKLRSRWVSVQLYISRYIC